MPDNQSSIYRKFEETARRRGSHPAVIYLGTRFSYRTLRLFVDKFAFALADLGVNPGDRVMLYLPNGIQWVVSWLAIQKLGATAVPITPIYTPHDLKYIANDSQATAIVCTDNNFGYVKSVLPDTSLEQTVVTTMVDLLPSWKRCFGWLFDIVPRGNVLKTDNVHFFRKLLKSAPTKEITGSDPGGGDLAEILYTGGTTSFPKGVPINRPLFLVSAEEQIKISEPLIPVEENVVFGNAPLFHILGQTTGLSTLLVGGTLILQPRINLDAVFDTIQRYQATTMIGVPTLYRMILEHDRLDQYDLGSVRYWFSAGDVLPEEVGNRWQKRFGKQIYQGYGATETCGGVAMCRPGRENPPKSVGQVVSSKEVMIVEPASLEPVTTGEAGELLVSSRHMVTRYLNKPEETEKSFVEIDGKTWYRTSDVMRMDQEGNLYFVDRTVDTIKHKGYRISASEVESVLQEHHAVISSCVIGIPDEKVGERIKAYVVLKEDIKGLTGYDLIKWCRKSLVSFKVPQYIEFRDMLPKSKVGKLLRREIRDEETQRSESG
ncbi:MAG: acyl--CoA ligase [Desulfohalobiaceae bacterium]|nr:acyl--CoA ligase [Desulfohalobiaceae bacterium]